MHIKQREIDKNGSEINKKWKMKIKMKTKSN